MNSTIDFMSFWGKARATPEDTIRWHPLALHSLDVAACVSCLLEMQPRLLAAVARLSGLSPEEARTWLLLAAALHDLGKFSAVFQTKGPESIPPVARFAGWRHLNDPGHALTGRDYWVRLSDGVDDCFEKGTKGRRRFDKWIVAACSHHGQIPGGEALDGEVWPPESRDAAYAYVRAVFDFFGGGSPLPGLPSTGNVVTWLVGGIVNLADWAGSDTGFFLYHSPDTDLALYWSETAIPKAREALSAKGLAPPPVSDGIGIADFFPETTEAIEPTPLQSWASGAPLDGNGPFLGLIEDFTGAGKTEAAFLLAYRMMRTGAARGLYWALPTKATSNAIHSRIAPVYRRFFTGEIEPSLMLAHGGRMLHAPFRQSLGADDARTRNYSSGETPAEAACAAWLASDRRLTFFSDVGVGTIDQALLGVMPSRFNVLRLIGLSQSVLIVDEAHSYDAYTGGLLDHLVTFQAALGGSTIVLSATLATARRQKLADAFAAGLGEAATEMTLRERGFPYAAILSPDGIHEGAVASGRGTRRDLPARRLESAEEAEEALANVAARGFCAAYIRNTVDDAIATAARLRATHPEITVSLFHARFAACDRATTEQWAIETFGKNSSREARAGHIVVSTQVIEQSLDVDFDAMASDAAPLDMLVQRAGRLQRHQRGENRPTTELLIVAPAPTDGAGARWLKAALPGTAAVYKNHARVWAGLDLVGRHGGLMLASRNPHDLFDAVYDRPEEKFPDGLRKNLIEQEQGKDRVEASAAARKALDPFVGYSTALQGHYADEAELYTRLGEPGRQVRLAQWNGQVLRPWAMDAAGDMPEREAWQRSEIALRASQFERFVSAEPGLAVAVEALEKIWRERRDFTPVVALTAGGEAPWHAEVKVEGKNRRILYDNSAGWRESKENPDIGED